MEKYFFKTTTLYFLTLSSLSNLPIVTNSTFKSVVKISNNNDILRRPVPNNSVENWYKFLATNDWKVYIARDTWVNKILGWVGDALIGKINLENLRYKIFWEYRKWPSNGNRTFSPSEYYELVDYTYNYMIPISNLFFSKNTINMIVFKTDSNKRWLGVYDASV